MFTSCQIKTISLICQMKKEFWRSQHNAVVDAMKQNVTHFLVALSKCPTLSKAI